MQWFSNKTILLNVSSNNDHVVAFWMVKAWACKSCDTSKSPWNGSCQWTIFGLGNVLSSVRCQAVTSTTADFLMMTSANGNIFRVTGPLCGEFTGHPWISITKASDAELLMFFMICAWLNGWVNNREAGDLRRHRAHYDAIVICQLSS